MIDVLMPQLGESVAEGTITRWLVREGDVVRRDQTLVEVATDKADTEIPAPAAGRIATIAAPAGAVVPKQGLLCRIDETAQPGDARPAAPPPAKPKSETPGAGEPAHATVANYPPGVPPASPSTRKLAHEMGVDL